MPGITEADGLLETPVERNEMRKGASEQFVVFAVALRRLRAEKIVAGRIQIGIDVAEDGADIEIVGELRAELRRKGLVVVVVGVQRTPRRYQANRGHIGFAGVIMREIKIVAEPPHGTAEPGGLVEGLERAALQRPIRVRRAAAAFRDDVDDTANRVRTVEAALRPAQHFDPGDVGGEDL